MTSVNNRTSLVRITQEVCARIAEEAPSVVIASTNKTVQLVYTMIRKAVNEIADDYPWPELQKEYTFTLTDGAASYALPPDFDRHINATQWNRAQHWPLIGPLDPVLWQQYKSGLVTTLPRQRFRIKGWSDTQFFIDPTPDSSIAGQTIAMEYCSGTVYRPTVWVTSTAFAALSYCSYNGNIYQTTAGGTTGATPPTWTSGTSSDGAVSWTYISGAYDLPVLDTDEVILDRWMIIDGATWRFKQARNQDYEEEKRNAEEQIEIAKTKLSGAEVLTINRSQLGPVGIGPWSYPEGNFNI